MYVVLYSTMANASKGGGRIHMNLLGGTQCATHEDAMVLAEVAVYEHAERLCVDYQDVGNLSGKHTGYALTTNNDTRVWYTARRMTDAVRMIEQSRWEN